MYNWAFWTVADVYSAVNVSEIVNMKAIYTLYRHIQTVIFPIFHTKAVLLQWKPHDAAVKYQGERGICGSGQCGSWQFGTMSQRWNLYECKNQHDVARVDIAGVDNAGVVKCLWKMCSRQVESHIWDQLTCNICAHRHTACILSRRLVQIVTRTVAALRTLPVGYIVRLDVSYVIGRKRTLMNDARRRYDNGAYTLIDARIQF